MNCCASQSRVGRLGRFLTVLAASRAKTRASRHWSPSLEQDSGVPSSAGSTGANHCKAVSAAPISRVAHPRIRDWSGRLLRRRIKLLLMPLCCSAFASARARAQQLSTDKRALGTQPHSQLWQIQGLEDKASKKHLLAWARCAHASEAREGSEAGICVSGRMIHTHVCAVQLTLAQRPWGWGPRGPKLWVVWGCPGFRRIGKSTEPTESTESTANFNHRSCRPNNKSTGPATQPSLFGIWADLFVSE